MVSEKNGQKISLHAQKPLLVALYLRREISDPVVTYEVSPCIMCVQYRGGCSVPWGVFNTVRGYLEYCGGCSVPWGDIMINVGDILSTVEGVQYRGGIS